MSGITGAINSALSGLQLFEAGIATVSNNLANASTPGYAVENTDAQTAVGAPSQPGDGVTQPIIQRAAAGFAAALLRGANSASAAATAQASSLTTISNALTNNGDVQSSLNQFFEDISTLAANPTSAGQRQTVLADAQSVVGTFQSAAGTLNGAISASSTTLNQNVASANNLLGQLAALNKSLRLAPNEPSLLDQQQAALNSLSSLIPINALPQANGSVIIASGGTILLDQSGAQTLSTANNTAGTPTVTAGADATPLTTTESDGAIGAAIASFQAGTAAITGLNAFAAVLASSVNAAQAEGLTPSGASGSPIFSVPAPAVTAFASNTGTAVVTASLTNPGQLPADGGPFLLTYSSATGWSALDQTSGETIGATGTPPTLYGISLNVTGAPGNGDQFALNPAPNAATGITVAATSPNDIAAADPYAATPGTLQTNGSILNSNGGTLTTGTDIVTRTPTAGAAIIPSSYFGQNLQLTFTSPTAYTVSTSAAPGTAIATGTFSGSGTNIAVAYGGAVAGRYWQLPVTGTPATGDTLTLTPGGANSGSNASRLGNLWSSANTTTSGTLQQAIVGLGTGLGANAQQAQLTATAATSQVTTATTNLQTVAGVNTDEQAVTLTNYQQAYQAAAQAIAAAHTAFESLLQSV